MKKKLSIIRDYNKWPRHYAAEIIAEHDIETRRKMLEEVPENFRAITKEHVLNYAERKKY